MIFQQVSSIFDLILMIFSRDFVEHCRKCLENLGILRFSEEMWGFSWMLTRILTEFWCEKFEWFDRSPIEPFSPDRDSSFGYCPNRTNTSQSCIPSTKSRLQRCRNISRPDKSCMHPLDRSNTAHSDTPCTESVEDESSPPPSPHNFLPDISCIHLCCI